MAKPKIGQILDPNKSYTRDAIHVPILPAVAQAVLIPGEPVGYVNGNAMRYGVFVGVVDPFLKEHVKVGEQFYIYLRPESTMKLWHEWTHPLVDKK